MWNLIAILGILIFPVAFALGIRRAWVAIVASTAALTLLVHLAGYIGAGYVDPFLVISIPVGIGAFLVWSFAITWIVRRVQRSRGKSVGSKGDGQGNGHR